MRTEFLSLILPLNGKFSLKLEDANKLPLLNLKPIIFYEDTKSNGIELKNNDTSSLSIKEQKLIRPASYFSFSCFS